MNKNKPLPVPDIYNYDEIERWLANVNHEARDWLRNWRNAQDSSDRIIYCALQERIEHPDWYDGGAPTAVHFLHQEFGECLRLLL